MISTANRRLRSFLTNVTSLFGANTKELRRADHTRDDHGASGREPGPYRKLIDHRPPL